MSMSGSRTVLWRRNDIVSVERCTLTERLPVRPEQTRKDDSPASPDDPRITLSGTVLIAADNAPAEIHYEIECSGKWHTRSARVRMLHRNSLEELELRSEAGRWWRNAEEMPELENLIDVDLGFTPSTNTLPIRRLGLEPGDSAEVSAVWVRFPDLQVRILPQRYICIDSRKYRYESRGGEFTADLEVDAAGLVINYSEYWERVAEYPPA